ncbi:MAG: hypothetical protein N3J91_13685 [Verrucomicrobiae bacterium]|nr:hypothetical protein [Verrucomicrobiae bacterium]
MTTLLETVQVKKFVPNGPITGMFRKYPVRGKKSNAVRAGKKMEGRRERRPSFKQGSD